MGHHQATRDGRRVEGKTEGGVMCRGGCKVLLLPLDNRMLRRMPVRSYFCWLPHQPGPSWRRIRTWVARKALVSPSPNKILIVVE